MCIDEVAGVYGFFQSLDVFVSYHTFGYIGGYGSVNGDSGSGYVYGRYGCTCGHGLYGCDTMSSLVSRISAFSFSLSTSFRSFLIDLNASDKCSRASV